MFYIIYHYLQVSLNRGLIIPLLIIFQIFSCYIFTSINNIILIRGGFAVIHIRPVSDLRNKFTEIEETVVRSNSPVFLTKNGYGTMVLLSIEQYAALTQNIEKKLDEADLYAQNSSLRRSRSDVFNQVTSRIDEQE